jgi:predicted secreted hydrolase
MTKPDRLKVGSACVALTWLLLATSEAGTEQTQDFRLATPGYTYRFPFDHGAHRAFRTEWWYYTGHLTTSGGRRFGYELTFFRRGIPPGRQKTLPSRWTIDHLYLAHFALTDIEGGRFHYAEKRSRTGLGKAGAETERLHVWIDRWRTEGSLQSDEQRLQAGSADFSIDLTVLPAKAPVVHGTGGISLKGAAPGQASHYYSLTRLTTKGTVTLGKQRYEVTGTSWMDHEFGSADLGPDLVGWDWFSIQLDNGYELMWYRLRHADGSTDPVSSGTLVAPDGHSVTLALADVQDESFGTWTSPASGGQYPLRWRMRIRTPDIALEIVPLLDDQELRTSRSTQVTYWEGAMSVSGTFAGRAVSGQGYLELTGYAERFAQRL